MSLLPIISLRRGEERRGRGGEEEGKRRVGEEEGKRRGGEEEKGVFTG